MMGACTVQPDKGVIEVKWSYRSYANIEEIKAANKAAGQVWFTPDTLSFFDGRVLPEIIQGRYFVTSEKERDGERRYTARYADESGRIQNASEFMEFGSKEGARMAAQLHAKEVARQADSEV